MKKFFSMAVVLMIIGMAVVGCKNENEPQDDPQEEVITDNPLYTYFKISKDFVGKPESSVTSTLTSNGFEFQGVEAVYMKVGPSYYCQTTYKKNASGVIYEFSMTVTPYNSGEGTYTPMLTGAYVKDAVTNKIGKNFSMGSKSVRFWRTYDNLTQSICQSFEYFNSVVDDNKFNQTSTIWLEDNIAHYNIDDESNFIGLKMMGNDFTVSGSTAHEYSVNFAFIDNTLKD